MISSYDERLRNEIARIAASNGGRVTPAAVVEDAKRKDSPLHDSFPWDDKAAAHQHRLDIARRLITRVEIVVTTQTHSIKAPFYVRDPRLPPGDQGYVSMPEIRGDEDLKRDVLVQEFMRASRMLRRAREMAAALELQDEVDDIVERVELLTARAAGDQAAGSMT